MARNTTPPAGKPASGDRLEVEITAIGAGGNAIARHEGFTLLVPRGVPGERARVVVEKVHPRYATARREAVLTPAAGGTEPACAHFEACRGCDWQHVAYPTQLAWKRQVLEDQLARIGGLAAPAGWEITPCDQPYEYRDKVTFVVAREGGQARPALHGPPGTPPVPIERCHLAPPAFSALATAALEFFAAPGAPSPGGAEAPERVTVQGTASGEAGAVPGLALTLHYPVPPAWLQAEGAAQALLAHLEAGVPAPAHLSIAFPGKGRRGGGLEVLKGAPLLTKQVGGRTHLVPPLEFFQVNPPQAGRMVDAVTAGFRAALPPGEGKPPLVLELFCGVGLFARALAEAGYRVAGVEKQAGSVRAARESARGDEAGRCAFQAADLGRPGALADVLRRHGNPAGILLNPPRTGLPGPLSEALLNVSPRTLLYVSCDGGTLARDAQRLAPRYDLTGLHGFDLFPQTHHLEVLATFEPKTG